MYKFRQNVFVLFSAVLFFVALFVVIPSVHAAIVINNTRVIYEQREKEVTVQINNQGSSPLLLQSWIDDGDPKASPDNLNVPFVLTPPINRVDAGKSQTVRIRYSGQPLPNDRESMFWFNALEIPAKANASDEDSRNFLQMAFRTRIKLFFRPTGLKGTPEEAAKALSWVADGNGITAINKTPWNISLVDMEVMVNGKKTKVDGDTVSPFGKRTFVVKNGPSGKEIAWRYVNDYGAVNSVQGPLGR